MEQRHRLHIRKGGAVFPYVVLRNKISGALLAPDATRGWCEFHANIHRNHPVARSLGRSRFPSRGREQSGASLAYLKVDFDTRPPAYSSCRPVRWMDSLTRRRLFSGRTLLD